MLVTIASASSARDGNVNIVVVVGVASAETFCVRRIADWQRGTRFLVPGHVSIFEVTARWV